jgi:hypothetical protein
VYIRKSGGEATNVDYSYWEKVYRGGKMQHYIAFKIWHHAQKSHQLFPRSLWSLERALPFIEKPGFYK